MKRVVLLSVLALGTTAFLLPTDLATAKPWHRVKLAATAETKTWRSPKAAESLKAFTRGRAVRDRSVGQCAGVWDSPGVLAIVSLCGERFVVRYRASGAIIVFWTIYQ